MGRKTWNPSPGTSKRKIGFKFNYRINFINSDIQRLEDALEAAKDRTLFIIGGGELYRQTLPICNELYVSEVHIKIEGGDRFFRHSKMTMNWLKNF